MAEEGKTRPTVTLTPSGLGQYIGYSGCPRFFRLKYFDEDIRDERNWYDPSNGSDLFANLGLAFEDRQLETMAMDAESVIGDADSDGDPVSFDETWKGSDINDIETQWRQSVRDQLSDMIADLASRAPSECDGPIVLFQTPMFGQIGVWDINGFADLIILEPLPDSNGIKSRVLEVKTAWKEKTSHQIQATIYSLLLDSVVTELGVDHHPAASVVNREADLRETPPSSLPEIDRSSRTAEVRRLLKRDGELHQLAKQSFEEVGYRLERKCDTCPYSGVCFTKGIEEMDPALLGITQGHQETLEEQGVDSLRTLSTLLEREEGTRPYDYDPLQVRDRETLERLENEGTLGDRLDELVQRAQLLRGELDPSYESFDNISRSHRIRGSACFGRMCNLPKQTVR